MNNFSLSDLYDLGILRAPASGMKPAASLPPLDDATAHAVFKSLEPMLQDIGRQFGKRAIFVPQDKKTSRIISLVPSS